MWRPALFVPLALVLGACATGAPPVPEHDRSALGAYLAGYVAQREGNSARAQKHLDEALRQSNAMPVAHRALRAALMRGDYADVRRQIDALPRHGRQSVLVDVFRRVDEFGHWHAIRAPQIGVAQVDEAADRARGLALAVPYLAAWEAAEAEDWGAARAALPREAMHPFHQQFAPIAEAFILDLAESPDAESAYANAMQRYARTAMLADSFARLLARRGNVDGARELYAVLATDPSGAEAAARGQAALDGGQKLPRLLPDARHGAADMLATLGTYLALEDGHEDALIALRLATLVSPDQMEPHLQLASFLRHEGRAEEAYAALTAAPVSVLTAPRVRAMRAMLAEDMGERDEALARWEALVDDDPTSTYVLDRADLLLRLSRYEEAASSLDPVVAHMEQTGNRYWWPYYARGKARRAMGQQDAAMADLREAVGLAPEEPDALVALARMEIEHGDAPAHAIGLISRALQVDPMNGAIFGTLGAAYLRQHQYDQAVDALERAVELRPSDALLLTDLGDAYWRAGRPVEARFQWRHALDLHHEESLKLAVRARLDDPIEVMKRP